MNKKLPALRTAPGSSPVKKPAAGTLVDHATRLERLRGYSDRPVSVTVTVDGETRAVRPVLRAATSEDLDFDRFLMELPLVTVRGRLSDKGVFAAWSIRWSGNRGRADREVELAVERGVIRTVTVYSTQILEDDGRPKREEVLNQSSGTVSTDLTAEELGAVIAASYSKNERGPLLKSIDGIEMGLRLGMKPSNRLEQLLHSSLAAREPVFVARLAAGKPFRWGTFYYRAPADSPEHELEITFRNGKVTRTKILSPAGDGEAGTDEVSRLEKNNPYLVDPEYSAPLFFHLFVRSPSGARAEVLFDQVIRRGTGRQHRYESAYLLEQCMRRLALYVLLRSGEHVVPEAIFHELGIGFVDLFWPENHGVAQCCLGDDPEHAAFTGARLRELADRAILPAPTVIHGVGSFRAKGIQFTPIVSLAPTDQLVRLSELLVGLVKNPAPVRRLLEFRTLLDVLVSMRLGFTENSRWFGELSSEDFHPRRLSPDTPSEERAIEDFLGGVATAPWTLDLELLGFDSERNSFVRKFDLLPESARALILKQWPYIGDDLSPTSIERMWKDSSLAAQGIPLDALQAQLANLARSNPNRCRGMIARIRLAAQRGRSGGTNHEE